jgi:hypothetical protein
MKRSRKRQRPPGGFDPDGRHGLLGLDVLYDEALENEDFVAGLKRGRGLLALTLQKHEREAVRVIHETAARHGVTATTITRGRNHVKVVLHGKSGRHVIGIASSPRDPVWCVRVARKQAEQACARIAGNGS